MTTVLESTGERIWCVGSGVLSAEVQALKRVTDRAGIEVPIRGPGFTGQDGGANLPFAEALRIAQAFASLEPETVLAQVDMEVPDSERHRREWEDSHLAQLHNCHLAGWALIRQ